MAAPAGARLTGIPGVPSDPHINQQRINQQRINQQRINQQRINQQRINQQRINQQRINQQRINQQRINQRAQPAEVAPGAELRRHALGLLSRHPAESGPGRGFGQLCHPGAGGRAR